MYWSCTAGAAAATHTSTAPLNLAALRPPLTRTLTLTLPMSSSSRLLHAARARAASSSRASSGGGGGAGGAAAMQRIPRLPPLLRPPSAAKPLPAAAPCCLAAMRGRQRCGASCGPGCWRCGRSRRQQRRHWRCKRSTLVSQLQLMTTLPQPSRRAMSNCTAFAGLFACSSVFCCSANASSGTMTFHSGCDARTGCVEMLQGPAG